MLTLPVKNGNRTQNLMTATVAKKIPAIRAQDGKGEDAIVYVKFFTPFSSWTWFITELDPETGEMFGKVYSHLCPEGEWGYSSLVEMSETVVGGMAIERDAWWKPKPMRDCKMGV